MINEKMRERARKKARENQRAAAQEVKARIANFAGITSPGPKAIAKYLIYLDELRDELTELYGDLGRGYNDAGGIIENERKKALALLAKLKIESAKPGDWVF